MRKQIASAFSVVMLLLAVSWPNAAALAQQPYPSKPVRIVVAYPAGGGTDFVTRQLANGLETVMQQTTVVDNRPGGNTLIAAQLVAKAPADGYTLFMATDSTMSLNPLVLSNLPYDPEGDFVPISLVASQAFFLVASPKVPFRTFLDLVAYAKANPGKVNYGTGSWGGALVGEKIKLDLKASMQNVPFKGLMLPALLSGDIDVGIALVVPYDKQVSAGKLVGLATTGPAREATLPSTPTMRELGFPELEFVTWTALFAPARTPAPIIDRLNADVRKALSDRGAIDRLVAAGAHPSASSPQELRALMRKDRERWGQVIQASGVKLAN